MDTMAALKADCTDEPATTTKGDTLNHHPSQVPSQVSANDKDITRTKG